MNVNSHADSLIKLHRDYVVCLKGSIDQFLKAEAPAAEGEFCQVEKAKYFDYMATHHQTEFTNIMNLEQNNF
jgi:hypothetical protein